MRVALDTFGGDNAPEAIIDGALVAAKQADQTGHQNLEITLVGNEDRIKKILGHRKHPRLKFLNTSYHNFEVNNIAVGEEYNSPIRLALRHHCAGEFDAVVSAGSTGAQVVASLIELEKCLGITRPAVGSLLPTTRGFCFLIDVGASLVAKAHHLVQFAAMGHVYVHQILGISNPRIGLLNVGQESHIGEKSVVDAFRLLGKTGLNFIGYLEGRDVPAGAADVIVTNGQIGNILLKYTEGIPELLLKVIPEVDTPRARARINENFDYESFGGEPLLGVKGVSIICHGSSSKRAIASAIFQANRIAEANLPFQIEEFIKEHFDSYFMQLMYLRSIRRSLKSRWQMPLRPGKKNE